jgi:hypothetical protein
VPLTLKWLDDVIRDFRIVVVEVTLLGGPHGQIDDFTQKQSGGLSTSLPAAADVTAQAVPR